MAGAAAGTPNSGVSQNNFFFGLVFNKSVEAVAGLETDAQLMLQVKAGDDESFALLLGKYRVPIVHYLYRIVHDRAVAEELAQEVFLRLYKARARYRPTAKFTTWIYRIATNLALNYLRDGKVTANSESIDEDCEGSPKRELVDQRQTPEEYLLSKALQVEIRKAIAALPERQRLAVILHKYQGLDYAQIATVLDCSESAVKSLLFRAYEKLRQDLAHLVK